MTTINDRVPTIELVKESSTPLIVSSRSSDITSNTIPESSSHNQSEDNRTTATYTIKTPMVSSISASISGPQSTSIDNKTDQDTLGKITASVSRINYVEVNAEKLNKSNNDLKYKTVALDTDVSMSATDDDKTDKKNTSNTPAPIETSLNNNSNAIKRSLFDMDNATSLSLADRLRNEANKYADDNRSLANTFGVTDNHNQNHKNSDDTSSGVTHGTLHLNTTTGATIVTERRPSWRLKLDAGSKVRYEHLFQLVLRYCQ